MAALTPEQRAELQDEIGAQPPASPELLLAAIRDQYQARKQAGVTPNAAAAAAHRALAALPAVLQRLIDAEQQLDTVRTTVARLIHRNDEGDDYGLTDLAWELSRAGVSVQPELDLISALANAEYAAQG